MEIADREPSVVWRLGPVYAALFLPHAVVTPYLQLLLQARGFAKHQIGVTQGVLATMAVLAPPLWGYLADRAGRTRPILLAAVVGAVPAFLLFGVAESLLAASTVAVLFGLFLCPQIPLTDGWAIHYIHRRGGNYGAVRIWASASFVVVAGAVERAGISAGRVGEVIFVAFAVCATVQAASVLTMPRDLSGRLTERPGRRPRLDLRRFLTRTFVVVAVAAFLGRVAMMSYYGFFTLFLKKMGCPNPGLVWMIGPISEIPVIYFSHRIMRRIGVRNLFALGLLGMVVRLVGFSMATSVWQVAGLQTLHGLTFGAYHVASVTFVSRLLPGHMKSTAQTLFSALTIGLGGICGGVLGGYLAGWSGFSALYLVFGGIAAAALAILLVLVPGGAAHQEANS